MEKEVGEVIDWVLQKGRVMQVATSIEDQPWVCSVYFVASDRHELYWLSWPERRHSQALIQNPKAAVTIAAKTDLPVIGFQAEGVVIEVTNLDEVTEVMTQYVARYNAGKKFVENFKNGTNEHRMYRFSPSKIILFDEVHFPDVPRKEVIV